MLIIKLLIFLQNASVGNLISNSLVFCERKSESHVKKSKSLLSLFCHKRIAHSRSFVKIDGSEWLMVALLFRATWVIPSWSIFKKLQLSDSQREQFTLWHKKGEYCQKHTKNTILLLLLLLLYTKYYTRFWERIAHSRSFLRAKWVIHFGYGCSLLKVSMTTLKTGIMVKMSSPNNKFIGRNKICKMFVLKQHKK